jgi:hypothetical protein
MPYTVKGSLTQNFRRSSFFAGVNVVGDRLFTGVNDTGEKSITCVVATVGHSLTFFN